MLFVLFVVGLLVSLTVPRFAAGYQQRELLAQRADIEDQLRELPRRVRLSAQPLQLPLDLKLPDLGDGSAPLHLPPGWEIAFDPRPPDFYFRGLFCLLRESQNRGTPCLVGAVQARHHQL